MALHEVTWCMVIWCTQNAPGQQQFHVTPALPEYTTSVDIQKSQSFLRITRERSEAAQEWSLALYKSDQQQQHSFCQNHPYTTGTVCCWKQTLACTLMRLCGYCLVFCVVFFMQTFIFCLNSRMLPCNVRN